MGTLVMPGVLVILMTPLSMAAQENAPEKNQVNITQEDALKQKQIEEDKVSILPDEDFVSEDEAGYVYKPAGRRDPFWDLMRGKNAIKKIVPIEGIKGLEIEQLDLEGILLKGGEYIALLKGPDGKPYDVKVGQSVYDGEIIKIDAGSVIFKKILAISLGGTKEKTIVKRLNPEEEKEEEKKNEE